MSDFMDIINKDKIALVVSLPRNDIKLAQAAIDAGADALKIHLNVHHHASGNNFGSLEDEKEKLEPIINLCEKYNVPIGVVPGTIDLDFQELSKVKDAGFSFTSMYDKDMDPLGIRTDEIYKLVAITFEYDMEWIKILDQLDFDVLECSIMHPDSYGTRLTMRDVFKLKSIRENTSKPLLLPTQKAIEPSQVQILKEIGINGLMIGAVVTEDSAKTIYDNTKRFRDAIDKL